MTPQTTLGFLCVIALLAAAGGCNPSADQRFEDLARRFIDELPALSPVQATQLGDHRFDGLLDEITPETRAAQAAFARRYLDELDSIERDALSPANQVDAALLEHELRGELWRMETLEEWAWNPLIYTGLSGGATYGLLARDFAPLPERLRNVAARLARLPEFFEQVRSTLDPSRVPRVHAETAARQNRGLLSILDAMVVPRLGELDAGARVDLEHSIELARQTVEEHQSWIEETLLPAAAGEFRLGCKRFDEKLAYTLHTPLGRDEIRARAEREFQRVRQEMYEVAREIVAARRPDAAFSDAPGDAERQAVIAEALEAAYEQLPPRDGIVELAREFLDQTTEFVREKDLVEVPDDPIEIIVMPEFQRGVAVAYCDSPGPLDAGQKTFYAVAPLPVEWDDEQVRSFLREYNLYSLQDLTIHEAMPGHFLQVAHSNRYPSTLRAVLSSGTFIEGWAVYAEKLMVDAGYMGGDPLMRLINLKWYLRVVTNALIDQAIHCDGMTEDEAMKLMVEGAFQEEREAAGKWTRAQLTSTQLSTYFVGYQEHADLRAETERGRGDSFSLREYHDELLSYGSPPAQFVRALMQGEPIPR